MTQFDTIIIGAGQAGPPLAVRLAKSGKKVALVERKNFGGTCVNTGCIPSKTLIASAEVAHTVQQCQEFGLSISGNIIVKKSDIDVYLSSNCIAFEQSGENIIVQLDCEQKTKQVSGSHILLAIGRTPNTQDLDLEKAGIKTDTRGYIQIDDQLQTNVSGIWALGECNGRGAFTHTAYNDHEIVADNLLENRQRRVTDRILAYALYIDPPLGRAGLSEEQARKSGRRIFIAKYPMTRVKRAIIKGKTDGFIKILIDADSKEILGAAIVGVGGDEIIHSILDIMYARKPYTIIKEAVHIHPTVSELIPTTLADLQPLNTQGVK